MKQIQMQDTYIKKIKNTQKNKKYSILTMGCQLNENDSERISGILEEAGYEKTEDLSCANIIVFNTCCVRENAEDRLFGKLGEVKKYKEKNGCIIAIGGCMMQEKHMQRKIKESYPFVDIIFGPHTLKNFPEDLYRSIIENKKIEDILDIDGEIIEGIPTVREDKITKKQERKAKREETIKKMKDFKDRVGDKIVDAKDSTVEISKRGIRAVVEFGREAKKATVKAIEGIGTKAAETRENVKEGLRTAVEQSSQKLEDLNGER